MRMNPRVCRTTLALIAAVLVVRAAADAGEPSATSTADRPLGLEAASAPANLTATFIDSTHIDLRWTNRAREAAGVFVEYGNPGVPDFIILTIGRPTMDAFRHRDVAPETTFLYRIRPFFGSASTSVEIATGRAEPGARRREHDGPLDPNSGAAADGAERRSLRRMPAAAAPDGFAVELGRVPTTVELRWNDRASDEDGYFVEMAPATDPDFKISALLPPDAVSYRMTGLAGETAYRFRVRAFVFGGSSEVVQVTTGSVGR